MSGRAASRSALLNALFSEDEKDEASEKKAAGKRVFKKDEATQFSSTARTSDHEVMLREVRALPQKRRSLLLSISDRLIGLDENESTNENLSNQFEESDTNKIPSSGSIGVVLNFTNEPNRNVNNLTSKEDNNGIGDGQHLLKTEQGREQN